MVATHDTLPQEETGITGEFDPDGRQYNCGGEGELRKKGRKKKDHETCRPELGVQPFAEDPLNA
jgi:hypothetical protein